MPLGPKHPHDDGDEHAVLHGIEAIRREVSEIRSALALLATKTDLANAIQNQLTSDDFKLLDELLRLDRRQAEKLEALAKKTPNT